MNDLIALARQARELAYVPYSGFQVGAAVETESGKVYTGCNIENASYGLCNCAERTAIFKAVSEGEMKFRRIAVVADTEEPTAPCGACRQVIAEFEIPEIVLANMKGDRMALTLEALLPHSFSKHDVIKGN